MSVVMEDIKIIVQNILWNFLPINWQTRWNAWFTKKNMNSKIDSKGEKKPNKSITTEYKDDQRSTSKNLSKPK